MGVLDMRIKTKITASHTLNEKTNKQTNKHKQGLIFTTFQVMSLSVVQIYDFHIFTFLYSTSLVYLEPKKYQLSVGLLAQLVEHWTGIAEVMGSNPIQA